MLAAAVLPTGCGRPLPTRPSVLLVSADSLRADRLALWSPDGVETPALAGLADRGVLYDNAWATSPWTAPSMVSVMTGLHPPAHGAVYRDDTTPPGLATLPRLLDGAGYRLGNFSFFSGISYFRNLGLPEPEPGLSHLRVAESFAAWLAGVEPERPFFAWVHLLEPHLPYGATGYRATEVQIAGSSGLERAQLDATVPVGTVEFADGDRERLLELYDRDVEAMDRSLATLLSALEETGRAESTLVIFVADHGEELLEDGWVGHASTSIEAKLMPEILHVPLVVAGPGLPRGEVESALVQQVDLLPTVVRLVGLAPPSPLDGKPLPGTGGSWLRRPRRLAFFDSSPGGNLTPQERRGERLQGVFDGRCLLVRELTLAGPERPAVVAVDRPIDRARREATTGALDCAAARPRLAAALERWQVKQGRKRLRVLARGSAGTAPSSREADGWPAAIEVTDPADGAELGWTATGGEIRLAWRMNEPAGDDGPSYWVEYRAGRGIRSADGAFEVEEAGIAFGPFPQGFWNDVAGYSPFRFRVLDAERRERSEWVTFRVAEVRPDDREEQR